MHEPPLPPTLDAAAPDGEPADPELDAEGGPQGDRDGDRRDELVVEVRDLVEQGEITVDTRVQYAHGLTVGVSESLHSVAELVPASALPVAPVWVPGVGIGS